jgi:hypothetical protein
MSKGLPAAFNIDTLPEITESGLDGDPKCWFIVYLEGTGWCKIEAVNVADIA